MSVEVKSYYTFISVELNWSRGFEPWQQQRGARWSSLDSSQHTEFPFGGTGFSDFVEQFFGSGGGFDILRQEPGHGPSGHSGFARRAAYARRGQNIEGTYWLLSRGTLKGSVANISFQRNNPHRGQVETHTYKVRIPPRRARGANHPRARQRRSKGDQLNWVFMPGINAARRAERVWTPYSIQESAMIAARTKKRPGSCRT